MTTIAWDGDTLAADSQATANDSVDYYHNKLTRLKDGSYCVTAGYHSDSIAFKEWLNGGDKPKLDDGFEAVVVTYGVAKYYHSNLMYKKIKPPFAIGSGWKWAAAAMDHGKNAKEAVKYARTRDIRTGGKINTVRFAK